MKYLGIDYGSRKIGLAVSDKEGKVAFPKKNIQNKGLRTVLDDVVLFINQENVEAIVVGHSANFRGLDNPIMRSIRQFRDSLGREINAPIFLEPEFFTSIQAGRITGKTKNLDAQAAAIILQSFLDKQNELDTD